MNKTDACKPIEFFLSICKIPHKSGDEKAIFNYLVQFAKDRDLNYKFDKMMNLLICKNGSPGHEYDEALIIQAHIDMVYVADQGTTRVYTDPLELQIEGDILSAKGTSLGADDGIGVAMMLALLDDDKLIHPPYEMLFTTQEEDGLLGAQIVPSEWLTGKKLLNLDGESEDEITVGCAGGFRSDVIVHIKKDRTNKNDRAANIKLEGMTGGHSGIDIGYMRGNANKVLGEILDKLERRFSIRIIHISGGMKMNVIPSFAEASICFPEEMTTDINAFLNDTKSRLVLELKQTDPDLRCSWSIIDPPSEVMNVETTRNIISAILLTPDGVLKMNPITGTVIETSNNLGVIETNEDGVILTCNPRSSMASQKDNIRCVLRRLAEHCGADGLFTEGYPAWEYAVHSPLRELYIEEFRKEYGKEPILTVLHAGLECGIIVEKCPGVDAISVGPDIKKVHSTSETVSISSIERNWKLITSVIEKL